MTLALVFALYFEAKPFIKKMALKPLKTQGNLQVFSGVFESNQIFLVISGTGKVASASAVSFLCATEKINHIINIGLCGAKKLELGEIISVLNVKDADTNRSFIVDPQEIPKNWQTKNLQTLSQIDFEQKYEDAVDLEASGFCEASSYFLDSHQIEIVKIVSDNANEKILDKQKLADILQKSVEEICNYIKQKDTILAEENFHFTEEEQEFLNEYFQKYRLSVTEQRKAGQLLHALCIQKSTSVTDLKSLLIAVPCTEYVKQGAKVLGFLEGELKGIY